MLYTNRHNLTFPSSPLLIQAHPPHSWALPPAGSITSVAVLTHLVSLRIPSPAALPPQSQPLQFWPVNTTHGSCQRLHLPSHPPSIPSTIRLPTNSTWRTKFPARSDFIPSSRSNPKQHGTENRNWSVRGDEGFISRQYFTPPSSVSLPGSITIFLWPFHPPLTTRGAIVGIVAVLF